MTARHSWSLRQTFKKTILLPPCVPKANRVHAIANELPAAVQVSVSLAASKDGVVKDDDAHQRRVDVVLLLEFKAPTAVAAATGSAVGGASGSAVELAEREWIYSKDTSESLHPCWGVRRLTNDALLHEKKTVAQMKIKWGTY